MMADIALVNLPYTLHGYKNVNQYASRSFPLGLGGISGVLSRDGFDYEVIDADAVGINIDETVSLVVSRRPRIIGMTTYTPYADMIEYAVNGIKKRLPDCIIVLGGHHAYALGGSLLDRCACDVVAVGEGETIFPDLCRSFLRSGSLETVGGVYFRKGDQAVFTGKREFISDLDSVPLPDYERFPMERYEGHYYRRWTSGIRRPFSNLITSRGCPFSCGFCSNVMWGKKVRYQSPERVIEEIDLLVRKYGLKQLSFFDDTFTLNMPRAVKICDLIIERGYSLDIYCSTRVDVLDEELVEKMARAGFKWVGIGIESGNAEILKRIGKAQTPQRCARVLQLLARYRIAVYGSVILGYPGETRKTMSQTLKFILDNPVHLPQFNVFIPYPGTPIYDELKGRGVATDENVNQFARVVSYNSDISARYLIAYQWYCYIRSFCRVSYLALIRQTFRLRYVFVDLIRVTWAMLLLSRDKETVIEGRHE